MTTRQRSIRLLCTAFLLLNIFFCAGSASAAEEDDLRIRRPEPRINIPGLQFSTQEELERAVVNPEDNTTGRTIIYVPFIGEYIAAVYRYAVAIASIVAVVMIIAAGFRWTISGGSSDVISNAKKTMGNAIVGLIIAVGSYTLLYTINPQLVKFEALKVYYTRTRSLTEVLDGGDTTNAKTGATIATNLANFQELVKEQGLSIECPGTEKTLAQDDLSRVARSFIGNVTYRFGSEGKGTANTPCPPGTACLDCSGFTQKVYQCAGKKAPAHGTGIIFTTSYGAEAIEQKKKTIDGQEKTVYDIDYDTNEVNGTKLEPGDLLGWREGEGRGNFGHVVMYVGDGDVIDANGTNKQVNANTMVKKLKELETSKTYLFRWILRYDKLNPS